MIALLLLLPSSLMPSPAAWPRAAVRRAPPPVAAVSIRLVKPTDLTQLAELTTSSLYGKADAFQPVMALQRAQILQRQRATLERRIGLEFTDAECRFFVAVEPTEFGERVCGSIDSAVHLFDQQALHFELEQNEMPEGGESAYRWSPYMASVAVSDAYRRRGVGTDLVLTAEAWAKASGYDEIMLEVSDLNEPAIRFYETMGYGILSSFAAGDAGGGGEVVRKEGFAWRIEPTGKHVMAKSLG